MPLLLSDDRPATTSCATHTDNRPNDLHSVALPYLPTVRATGRRNYLVGGLSYNGVNKGIELIRGLNSPSATLAGYNMARTSASVAACGYERSASVRAKIYSLIILSMPLPMFGNTALAESPSIADESAHGTIDSDDKAHGAKTPNATKRYRSIGDAESFAEADGSVWLFCVITEFTSGHGYGGGGVLGGEHEFVAFRITPLGEVTRWSKKEPDLTTQGMGKTLFCSKDCEVYGFLWTGDVVKFTKSGKATGKIVDIRPTDIGFPDFRGWLKRPHKQVFGWEKHLDEMDRSNRNDSFVKLFYVTVGSEPPTADIFRKHKLGLAIRFEFDDSVPDGVPGWQRAIADSLVRERPWKKVLIDVK